MGIFSPLRMRHMATPPTPAAGESTLYVGSDGLWRSKNPSGVELALSGMVYDDTGWITPTLQNGWVQYPGWATVGYRRINGIVYLRGLIRNGTTADGTVLFQLPPGFRIAAGQGAHFATGGANQFAMTKVLDSGNVTTAAPTQSTWHSLDGIQFPASDWAMPTAITNISGDAPVTNGTNVNAASTRAYLRAGQVTVNVNATTTGAVTANTSSVLFTLPVGYRPPAPYYADIIRIYGGGEGPMRVHVETDGRVINQATALTTNDVLRGSITFPGTLDSTSNAPAVSGWQSFTPTLSNWGLGSGTLLGRYQLVGKTVHYKIVCVLGSGFTAGTAFQFALPLPVALMGGYAPGAATALLTDAGTVNYLAHGVYTSTSVVVYRVEPASNYIWTVSATTPFTWVAGDFVEVAGSYETV